MTPEQMQALRARFSWDNSSIFIRSMEVPASDIDTLDHANNAAYLRWMEDCAWSHATSLGVDWHDYQQLGVAVVVRRHELDYLAASFAGEQLHVGTWIDKNDGRLTLWRGFQIIREHDGKTILRARSQFVCVRLKDGRPCRMPAVFREAYRAM